MANSWNRCQRLFTSPVFRQGAVFACAIWALMVLASTSQLVLSTSFLGRPLPWLVALKSAWRENYPWVLLIPLVLCVSTRFPLDGTRWAARLSLHLLAALFIAALYSLLQSSHSDQIFFFQMPVPGQPDAVLHARPEARELTGLAQFRVAFTNRAVVHLLTYAVIVVCWQGLEAQRQSRHRERLATGLARQLAEARLNSLRAQIQPHFLFNTLNTISSLVHDQPDLAEDIIGRLGDLLRDTLDHEGAPMIPLRQELQLLDRYLEIEQARFGERLRMRREVCESALAVPIPTFLLQPLAENAIRHGLWPKPGPGELLLKAAVDNSTLVLCLSDTGIGLPADLEKRSGVGLSNTVARLRELYGENFSFTVSPGGLGGTRVEIRIPCQASFPAAERDPESESV